MFRERCLAYTFLRAQWGASVITPTARRIFWRGVNPKNGDGRLRAPEQQYRSRIKGSLSAFSERLAEVDKIRSADGKPTVRSLFEELVDGLKWQRKFPDELRAPHKQLIGEVRRFWRPLALTRFVRIS